VDENLGYALDGLTAIFGVAASLYLLLALWHVLRFRPAAGAVRSLCEPVTVLKPLCGPEPRLEECLRSFCRQDLVHLQIICGLSKEDDRTVAIVERLIREFPARDIILVVDETPHGPNRKVSNLANMMKHARHEIVVVSDSDIYLDDRDALSRVMARLEDAEIGAVTCPYRSLPDPGLANTLGGLQIDDRFFPETLIAARRGSVDFCLGPVTAVRRHVLEAIGGFHALADHLADDYMLGQLVVQAGYRVELAPVLTGTVVSENFASLVRRELRWGRTIRATEPVGHAAAIVTHGLPIMLVLAIVDPGMASALGLAAVIGLRLALRFTVARRLSGAAMLHYVLLRDVLSLAIWLATYASRTVHWRDRAFVVATNGTLVDVSSAAQPAIILSPTRAG
jgi:ceramide glucosyltransferase